MFLGHFGIAFAAKKAAPQVSLGTLFLAAQFIDLLWPTLLLLGLERVQIAPGNTHTPLEFEHYPISHSLVAAIIWGILLGLAYLLICRRQNARGRAALIIVGLVISHWLLDALVHRPDLPLYPGSHSMIGLGLWHSLSLTLAVEIPLFTTGIWLYARSTVANDTIGDGALWALVAILVLIYCANLFGNPLPSRQTVAWVGELQCLLVALAYWIDPHRRPLLDPLLETDSLY